MEIAYKIKITEKLERIVEVTAINKVEALGKVADGHKNEFYILDSSDFTDVEFRLVEDEEDDEEEAPQP